MGGDQQLALGTRVRERKGSKEGHVVSYNEKTKKYAVKFESGTEEIKEKRLVPIDVKASKVIVDASVAQASRKKTNRSPSRDGRKIQSEKDAAKQTVKATDPQRVEASGKNAERSRSRDRHKGHKEKEAAMQKTKAKDPQTVEASEKKAKRSRSPDQRKGQREKETTKQTVKAKVPQPVEASAKKKSRSRDRRRRGKSASKEKESASKDLKPKIAQIVEESKAKGTANADNRKRKRSRSKQNGTIVEEAVAPSEKLVKEIINKEHRHRKDRKESPPVVRKDKASLRARSESCSPPKRSSPPKRRRRQDDGKHSSVPKADSQRSSRNSADVRNSAVVARPRSRSHSRKRKRSRSRQRRSRSLPSRRKQVSRSPSRRGKRRSRDRCRSDSADSEPGAKYRIRTPRAPTNDAPTQQQPAKAGKADIVAEIARGVEARLQKAGASDDQQQRFNLQGFCKNIIENKTVAASVQPPTPQVADQSRGYAAAVSSTFPANQQQQSLQYDQSRGYAAAVSSTCPPPAPPPPGVANQQQQSLQYALASAAASFAPATSQWGAAQLVATPHLVRPDTQMAMFPGVPQTAPSVVAPPIGAAWQLSPAPPPQRAIFAQPTPPAEQNRTPPAPPAPPQHTLPSPAPQQQHTPLPSPTPPAPQALQMSFAPSPASVMPPVVSAVVPSGQGVLHHGPSNDISGGKGKGKGKGKKGGKGREITISKYLSKVLRHEAASLGLRVGADGFIAVRELLSVQMFQDYDVTIAELQAIVNSNDKARFEIEARNDQFMIRAVQGHSMKSVRDEEALTKLSIADSDLPAVCVHGTYKRHLNSINAKGLLPGGLGGSSRNHVHFASYEPGDGRVISGMRYDCEVAVYIDLRRALQDGISFFRSANGVILSGSIPSHYIAKVNFL